MTEFVIRSCACHGPAAILAQYRRVRLMDAITETHSDQTEFNGWRPKGCQRIALVLQGGGALGAYQAGVYQALHEADIEPDWVSGVSIGAINSAIIAGNTRGTRLRALRDVLGAHHRTQGLALHARWRLFRKMRNAASCWMTMTQGQPGFFTPRSAQPVVQPARRRERDELLRQRAADRDA